MRRSSSDSIQVLALHYLSSLDPGKFPEGEGRWSTSGRPPVMTHLDSLLCGHLQIIAVFLTNSPSTPHSRPFWPVSAAFSAQPPILPLDPVLHQIHFTWSRAALCTYHQTLSRTCPFFSLWSWLVFPYTSGARSRVRGSPLRGIKLL